MIAGLAAAVRPVAAAFVATTANGGNSVAAATTFPTYPASVGADSPWLYHRGEDAVSGAATSTAADDSSNARPGTYNAMTNGPSTRWDLSEGTGTMAHDGSGAVNTGTIGAGNAWLTDRTDSVLDFNGTTATTGYVNGAASGVRTDRAFTATAWVRATTVTASQTAVSQAGSTASGFYLQAQGGSWMFKMPPGDSTSGTSDTVTVAATANVWTHLAGVFDSAANTITLYVNGVSRGTASHTSLWNATGPVMAGRSWFNNAYAEPWAGQLDDIRTYRRALSAAEIAAVYGDAPSLRYDFEENAGTTVADRSGNANTATLAAGATWTTAGHTGNALALTANSTSYASSASTPINPTQSFSISAWVNLNTGGTATRAVVSQQGTTYSTYLLKYESTGRWAFILTTGSNGVADQVTSSVSAALNTWVHLVAVYDSAAAAGSAMKLYVNNGTPVTGSHTTTYGTTNPMQIGRSMYGGWTDLWDGEIDDLRTYQRALTTTEIATLYSPPATEGMTAEVPGALQGAQQGQQSTTAVAFSGTSTAYNNTLVVSPGPMTFTIECWFKVGPGDAGGLIGYNTIATGLGGSYDRLIYIDTQGKVRFGVNPTGTTITVTSPSSYNDGAWHHVAATLGNAGMRLYVDGKPTGTPNTSVTTAGSYAGYWRWGGTRLTGWTNRPNKPYLVGTLDEFAVYTQQLTAQQIAWHYYANH